MRTELNTNRPHHNSVLSPQSSSLRKNMNELKIIAASSALALLVVGCASYNAFTKAGTAEKVNDWDQAVVEYQKALEIEPDNIQFRMALQHAKLEASRVHFEKGKSLRTAAATA